MRRALVLGKFYPFHIGHEKLIEVACSQCDHLTVLVCASSRETIPVEQRVAWLRSAYPDQETVSVVGLAYDEDELPNTSVSNREVSRLWAERCKELLPPLDLVVTGEPYGDFLAEFMGVSHFRIEREPCLSSTAVRDDIIGKWDTLNRHCRRDLVRKITITGTESTGKSFLAQRLAEHFETSWVCETAREIVSHTDSCTAQDLHLIAEAHAQRIEEGTASARRVLFIDTDVNTTISYAAFLFDMKLEVSNRARAASRADLVLYLDRETPYVQDGTRLERTRRDALDQFHRLQLERAGVPCTVLRGSYDERFTEAVRIVEGLIPF